MKFGCGTTVPVYKDLIISTIVDRRDVYTVFIVYKDLIISTIVDISSLLVKNLFGL